jgi:prevent-host-death family protein
MLVRTSPERGSRVASVGAVTRPVTPATSCRLENAYYGHEIAKERRPMHDISTVAEAKAKFSEVPDRALSDGPQTITRNGRPTAVIVSAEE